MRELYGNYSEGMNLADLHIHTKFSNDAREGMTPDQTVELAERIGLDSIAITDHDLFHPSIRAWDASEKMNSHVRVVPGMEVSTRDGHLIALFINEEIPPAMPVDETIQAIHHQGGFAIVPHPEFLPISSVKQDILNRLIHHPDSTRRPDGIEVFNGGVFDYAMRKIAAGKKFPTLANEKALQFYRDHGSDLSAAIASSDAHRKTLGRFVTGYDGHLREAIKSQQTVALARNLSDIEQLLTASEKVFGSEFDPSRIREWIDRIRPFEDQYFSYIGK